MLGGGDGRGTYTEGDFVSMGDVVLYRGTDARRRVFRRGVGRKGISRIKAKRDGRDLTNVHTPAKKKRGPTFANYLPVYPLLKQKHQ